MLNPPLIFSGMLVAITGFILFFVGLQAFWILAAVGVLMVVVGFFTEKREEVVPENPGMKFCWYCLREIPVEAEECMYCGLRQEPLKK